MWRIFGFEKRPKYGSLVNWFRRTWKVQLEDRLARELHITPVAIHVVADSISVRDIEEIVAGFVVHDLVDALGYESRDVAVSDLYLSIRDYAETPIVGWSRHLLVRLDVANIPDRSVKAQIIIGSVKYAVLAGRIMNEL